MTASNELKAADLSCAGATRPAGHAGVLLDHAGTLAGVGAEVPPGGLRRGVAEQRLDLRWVGVALPQPHA
jgi:hypothetical protein